MKIDWKHLSTTPGYKSLKKCVADDIKNRYRSKKELRALFVKVIGLAQNHAHHTGDSMEDILNAWEEARDCWWLNFYNNHKLPKLRHKSSIKPMGINGLRNYYKKCYRDPIARKHSMCKRIQEEHRKQSTKKKKRWTKEQRINRARWA